MTPGCPEDPQRLSDGGYPLDQLGSSPVRVLRTPGGSRASNAEAKKGRVACPSSCLPEEGLETHGRTLCGLGVRPRGRRELRRIKVAPKVQRARNPAGPLLSVPEEGLEPTRGVNLTGS